MQTYNTRTVTRIEEALGAPSFAQYMATCLYDAEHGYYAAGRVEFGKDRHFWTYPQRMSPLFGWMVAEAVRPVLEELSASDQVPGDAPLTLLELGAGNGDLSRDMLNYIRSRRDDPRWSAIAERVRLVVGDRSSSLRQRQEATLDTHIAAGRAEVRAIDATDLGAGTHVTLLVDPACIARVVELLAE